MRAVAAGLLALGLLALPSSSSAAYTAQPRVVGGTEAAPDAHPWAAALVRHEREGGSTASRQFCGGALVASRVVLTGAHCVAQRTPSGIQVVLGRTDLDSTGGEVLEVSAKLIHPF